MDEEKKFGNYRAKVVDNKDPEKYGRVRVWIPDVMPEVSEDQGLWAHAANTPLGGRNADDDCNYYGSSYIPEKGAWVWVFFESGNVNRPFYFGSVEIKSSKVLPECQLGSNYEKKWVILKSKAGRTIVVSDDDDDCRVEITGKKRSISSPPEGDTGSVYTIDGNQSTILMDERAGKEKILIKTYQGDYINVDVANRKLHIKFQGDINIRSNQNVNIEATQDVNIKAANKASIESGANLNVKAGANLNSQSGGDMNHLAGGTQKDQASQINHNMGAASADAATEPTPNGERG